MTLLIFTLIVVIHEGGHCFAARRAGVTVEEFAVGMGPVLFKFTTKKNTVVSFRLLPIGGYCRMYGEEGTPLEDSNTVVNEATGRAEEKAESAETEAPAEEAPKKVGFNEVSVWKRIGIVIAGPLMNFVLAFVLLLAVNLGFGYVANRVASVEAGAPAEAAGLMPGDTILKVNGHRVHVFDEASYILSNYSGSGEIELLVRRADGTKETLRMTPFFDEEGQRYRVGFSAGSYASGGAVIAEKGFLPGLGEIIAQTFWYVGYEVKMTLSSIGMLFTGALGLDSLSGPIGIVTVTGELYQEAQGYGFGVVLGTMANLTVLLSANLGVLNLFPIPGLDGSRVIILLIEKIRKKPMNQKVESLIYLIGFVLLIGLMIAVAVSDIMKLV